MAVSRTVPSLRRELVEVRTAAAATVFNPTTALRRALPAIVLTAATGGWATLFAWLAVTRHLALGSHAEDLGFTDQVIANFLRGQWFRMSIYQGGATWNTELDLSALARPDSLLAFHVEPMLLLFVPLYAVGGGVTWLLVVQAAAFAAGAVPAYRLSRHLTRSASAGLAVAATYLLSPLGQWAVLSDFHTSTLAAPLLLLALERLIVAHSRTQALASLALAVSAREDVGPVVACLGLAVLARERTFGLAAFSLGSAWTAFCAFVIHAYSGGVSPFDVRYHDLLTTGLGAALPRPTVLGNVTTIVLGGGWLAVLSPLSLLPALPSLLANVLSSSPWMAAGRAHYSALMVPFVVAAAAFALRRLAGRPRLVHGAAGMLVLGSLGAYVQAGAGPFGAEFAPAVVTAHARQAQAFAEAVPASTAVSATADLVPHLTRRPRVYVFPAVLDADYIFLDLTASPAPTSAGDVFLRIQSLVENGGWRIDAADNGLLLLERADDAGPISMATLRERLFPSATSSGLAGDLTLLDAALVPSPDGAMDVDGPHWILRTTWRAPQTPPPPDKRLDFWLDLRNGERIHVWDYADAWWKPPSSWAPGAVVTIDVPDVPIRQFGWWQVSMQ